MSWEAGLNFLIWVPKVGGRERKYNITNSNNSRNGIKELPGRRIPNPSSK